MERLLIGLVLLFAWAAVAAQAGPDRPNIVWIVAEDLSPMLPAFGDTTIATPNLSWLAAEGVCYDNVYASTPVCAPARAALATGLYANHFGANHMRTGPWVTGTVAPATVEMAARNMPKGIPPYEAIPPAGARMLSEYLRLNGYYCTNNDKEDYQFRKPVTAWDESSSTAHWRDRPPGQPFFSVFNLMVTHESQIWARADDSLWVDEDLPVPVPPYLPDTEIGRRDIRRAYSNVREMDARVGRILAELKEDDLLDNTIIVWYSDHGGPLPRQKRLLYDSGLRVPMVIRFPGRAEAGSRDDRLISFVDFAPTMLSVAGIKPPGHMDGQAWMGEYAGAPRQYVFAAADRFGPSTDHNRAARDHRFKYIRYYQPDLPRFLHTPYRDQMDIMQELYRLRDAGQLTDVQAQWFRTQKPEEELFDTFADPHEVNDLARDPAYAAKLRELRSACTQWVAQMEDRNLWPESELIDYLWPDGRQPVTATPVIQQRDDKVIITSTTPGASLGYQWLRPGEEAGAHHWSIYTDPLPTPAGSEELVVIAHRIGYLPSAPVRFVPANHP